MIREIIIQKKFPLLKNKTFKFHTRNNKIIKQEYENQFLISDLKKKNNKAEYY